MATLMMATMQGMTPEVYDAINRELNFPDEVPDGLLSHTAAEVEGGMQIVDVWESMDKFEAFMNDQLGPAAGRAGFEGGPVDQRQGEVRFRWSS